MSTTTINTWVPEWSFGDRVRKVRTEMGLDQRGPQPVEWTKNREPVWAWVQYTDRPAARIAAYASGWNDRIVVIVWNGPGGERSIVVWRNAVTKRIP